MSYNKSDLGVESFFPNVNWSEQYLLCHLLTGEWRFYTRYFYTHWDDKSEKELLNALKCCNKKKSWKKGIYGKPVGHYFKKQLTLSETWVGGFQCHEASKTSYKATLISLRCTLIV